MRRVLAAVALVVLAASVAVTAGVASADETRTIQPVPMVMQRLVNLVAKDRVPPPVASRVYAYTAIAMARATVTGDRAARRFTAALVKFPTLESPAGRVDINVAAVAAGASMGRLLMPVSGSRLALAELRDDILARYQERIARARFRASVDWGLQVSRAVRVWSDADGFAAAQTKAPTYVAPTGPGLWIPTPPAFQPAIQPYWGTLRGFQNRRVSCTVPEPIPYSTGRRSAYVREVRKVLARSRHLSTEDKRIARFWADDRGRTGTPAGHWVAITNLAIHDRDLETADAAKLQAAVTSAVADAFIVDWRGKYRWNTVRPITVINDWKLARDWSSYLTTPAFPEYPSGHATISWAAAEVLEARIGSFSFTDKGLNAGGDVRAGFGIRARHFDSFRDAATEATDSRFLGGIHFDATQRVSAGIGRCLAKGAERLTEVQGR